jgi:ABC-type uncharacterized transport system permease subunit
MDLADLGAAIRIAFIYFTILYLTGLGGLFSERSGIVNIGLEGLMVIGTVTGAAGAEIFAGAAPEGLGWGVGGVVLGLLFGALCGALFAGVHALATITFRVDHIVSGVVINLAAIGLARFLSFVIFEQATQSDPGGPHLPRLDIPLLSDIPEVGRAFTSLSPVVLFAAFLVFPVWFVLYRTRWGLRLRSAGETPRPRDPSAWACRACAGRACSSRARSRDSPARSSRSRSSATGGRARRSGSGSSRSRR